MGITIKALYKTAREELRSAGLDAYEFEADCIIEHFSNIAKEKRYTHPELQINKNTIERIMSAIRKRIKHYPLQYIMGMWEFYGRDFKVGTGVLIPRQDTETLVEVAIKYIQESRKEKLRYVDLFSGSGCVAISVEKEMHARISDAYAVEYDKDAGKYLTQNIERLNSNVDAIIDDALALSVLKKIGTTHKFDLITANPPYLTSKDMHELQEEVKYEPMIALYGGTDGLYYYKKAISLWHQSLSDGGMFAVEIGLDQHDDVKKIFEENGYKNIEFYQDYSGIIRVVSGIK